MSGGPHREHDEAAAEKKEGESRRRTRSATAARGCMHRVHGAACCAGSVLPLHLCHYGEGTLQLELQRAPQRAPASAPAPWQRSGSVTPPGDSSCRCIICNGLGHCQGQGTAAVACAGAVRVCSGGYRGREGRGEGFYRLSFVALQSQMEDFLRTAKRR